MNFKNGLNGTVDFCGGKFYCRFIDADKNDTPPIETTPVGVCKLIDELSVMDGEKSFVGIFKDTEHEHGMNISWFRGTVGWKLNGGELYISDESDGKQTLYKFGDDLRSLLFSVNSTDVIKRDVVEG